MTTRRQIEANRKNALSSTGAVTSEGRKTVSRNAIKHGIFAKDVVIETGPAKESRAEYEELLEGLMESCSPQGKMEHLLVEKIAIDFWRLRRVMLFESGSIKKYLEDTLESYYNSWAAGRRHYSIDDLDEKIEEAESQIEWMRADIACLEKGQVTFSQAEWKGEGMESNVEDDLYFAVNLVESERLSEAERRGRREGALELSELKQILAREGYTTDKQLAEVLVKCFSEQIDKSKSEVEQLHQQKRTNRLADELNGKLCALPPTDSLDKALKYEASIQRSILQNYVLLRKLQLGTV